jgi:hypothetical protein
MKEHKMPVSRQRDHKESKDGVGLLALGVSGPWEVAIDETLAGPRRYFAQIEGPSVYLYFELATVKAIDEALDFFSVHPRDARAKPFDKNGKLSVAKNADAQISLTRDNEYDDRYFLVIEAKSGPHVQFTIADDDLSHIVKALRDAKDNLADDE